MRDTSIQSSMKLFKLLVVAAIAASTVPLLAQSADASAQQSGAVSAGAVSAGATDVRESSHASVQAQTVTQGAAGARGIPVAELRPVTTELQGKLDSKTAKVGDSVAVKTKAAVKTADGTVLPKGTRLVGHVTDVQPRQTGNAEGRMGILLDRAELKGGQSLAIYSMIQSVEPPESTMAMTSAQSDDGFAAPSLSASGRSAAKARVGGGGPMGANSVLGASTPEAALPIGETTSAVAGATANVGSSVHALSGISGGVVAHGTGVPGVALAGNVSNTSSGTLFASKKDVHLDGGTQLVLGVATTASLR